MLPPDPRRQRYHAILLGLRAAIVLILIALVARPFFSPGPHGRHFVPRPRRQLILIDTSASMRRAMLWHAAEMTVLVELHRTRPEDTVALYTFDEKMIPLLSFAEWNDMPIDARIATAFRRISSVSPGWGGTRLGAALVKAANMLGSSDGTAARFQKQILVICDDRGAKSVAQLDHYAWPPDIQLVVMPLRAEERPEEGLRVVETKARPATLMASAR